MGSLISLILPALVPAFTDGVRGLFAKITGGAGGQPQNMQERIQLIEAETERLKALAQLDAPNGEPSKWIIDLRACYRYVIVTFILVATIVVVYSPSVPATIVGVFLDMTGACMSFIIGERMYLAIKK
ncbi:hypothetical protein EB001_14735 [bacterium]|nr:hypothetical protein [bacterium]